MDISTKALFLAAALATATAAYAQTPAPPTGAGDPSAASTPHQRSTTGAKTPETPTNASPDAAAASSPHQHATAGEGGLSAAKLKMAHQDGAVPATFVKKAALDGMTEVELGKVALSKSQDPSVRKFAERMVKDHGKANMELAALAKSKGMDVPKSLDAEHQSIVQTLSAKSGAAFDSAYAEHMAMDHAKAVALFEGASGTTDGELSSFAKKTLPTLKEHKQMADGLPKMRSADAADTKKK
jgi:putative membrane protein